MVRIRRSLPSRTRPTSHTDEDRKREREKQKKETKKKTRSRKRERTKEIPGELWTISSDTLLDLLRLQPALLETWLQLSACLRLAVNLADLVVIRRRLHRCTRNGVDQEVYSRNHPARPGGWSRLILRRRRRTLEEAGAFCSLILAHAGLPGGFFGARMSWSTEFSGILTARTFASILSPPSAVSAKTPCCFRDSFDMDRRFGQPEELLTDEVLWKTSWV